MLRQARSGAFGAWRSAVGHRSATAPAPKLLRSLLSLLLAIFALITVSRDAHAFAWTIRHGYTSCTPCHIDPSGSGPLSEYGRAVADEAINTPWGDTQADGEAAPSAQFLWGGVKLPEPLTLQGDLRFLHLRQKVDNVPLIERNIFMQVDFAAALQLNHFTAMASLGYAAEGALGATLTNGADKNLVSRYHWLGYSLINNSLMIRAGRYAVPFGLRSIEHTLWARVQTHSNINDQQQYGASAVYLNDRFRAEFMLIAGNFQLRPDRFRERGYSSYIEGYFGSELALGLSSLITYRRVDPDSLKETYRQAHGVFGRWSTPWKPLVVLGEADYVLETPRGDRHRTGMVGYLQADIEPTHGIHLILTGESHNVGQGKTPASFGGWVSYAWFFAPHVDLRLDGVYQDMSLGQGAGRIHGVSFLLQGHLYL